MAAVSRLEYLIGAELHVVAMNAVREAENLSEFVRHTSDEAGVPVSVISGSKSIGCHQFHMLPSSRRLIGSAAAR